MTHKELTYLLQAYEKGSLSPEQSTELVTFLAHLNIDSISDAHIRDWVMQSSITEKESDSARDIEVDSVIQQHLANILAIDKQLGAKKAPTKYIHFPYKWRWATAAVVLLFIGGYLWKGTTDETPPLVVSTVNEILPGKEGAILTLADGSQVVLDSLENGLIAHQNGAEVHFQNGQISYDVTGDAIAATNYNTISTPKGRQFRINLPDGTQVLLNAASSIRYPIVFPKNERRVWVTGEAYLNVSRNSQHPFIVSVEDKNEIQVLGTEFNVNAYPNEGAIKTTLLEGSIRVHAYNQIQLLKPGEQTQLWPDQRLRLMKDVDIAKAVAWKNGYFNFTDSDLYEIMRQIERWYDIEVVFLGPAPNIEFNGKLERSLTLSQMLDGLHHMKVKFTVEGKKLIIEP